MKEQESTDDRSPFLASLNSVPACKRRMADTDWYPAVDVSDRGEEYLFEFDLPGLTRKEIQIRLDGNALSLTGVRTTLRRGGTSLRVERPAGAFVRRIVLPADTCNDQIRATLQDGVLQLHVPRKRPPTEDGKSNTVQFEELEYEHAPA